MKDENIMDFLKGFIKEPKPIDEQQRKIMDSINQIKNLQEKLNKLNKK